MVIKRKASKKQVGGKPEKFTIYKGQYALGATNKNAAEREVGIVEHSSPLTLTKPKSTRRTFQKFPGITPKTPKLR